MPARRDYNRRIMKILSVAFLVAGLAFSGCSETEVEPADELTADSSAAGGASASAPGDRDSSPPSDGGSPAEDPSALKPPAASCNDRMLVTYRCWTEKSAPDVSSKSDIACRFTLSCCGAVVQEWERQYPQSAGPSGVVYSDSRELEHPCSSETTVLADVDGDGVSNVDDGDPLTAGQAGYPW